MMTLPKRRKRRRWTRRKRGPRLASRHDLTRCGATVPLAQGSMDFETTMAINIALVISIGQSQKSRVRLYLWPVHSWPSPS